MLDRVVLLSLAFVLTFIWAVQASPAPAFDALPATMSHAASFELRDQYENTLTYKFPKQKISVLTFGDRKGSEQIEGWVRPLYDRYQTRIDQNGVAVLSSVPSFARGIVRRIFKSKVKYPVLLDWKGDVASAYGYQNNQANLYVIDRDGRIVLRLTGAANPEQLNRVFAQIDRML